MTMKIQKLQSKLATTLVQAPNRFKKHKIIYLFLQSNKKNQIFYESWLVKTY
jgi:hypothetical protein